jgi:hypothetical protein
MTSILSIFISGNTILLFKEEEIGNSNSMIITDLLLGLKTQNLISGLFLHKIKLELTKLEMDTRMTCGEEHQLIHVLLIAFMDV